MLVDTLIQTYVMSLKVGLAVEAVGRAWQYGFRLSLLLCNLLLSALVDEGKIKIMEHVYKEMIRRRVHPNLVTFNMVINGFCKVGQLQRASDLLEDIKLWGLSPSFVTYNTLIDGCCKGARVGKMDKVDALLKEMMSMNISPDEITYSTLIDGFCKDQNLLAALKVYKEMHSHGWKPGLITYITY
ncbi:pentatricopeptide repeat-containing protein At1g09820-like [Beta vulgaris subsp. vulgaris]|uniref:pentatricopeptide repeat-containing protein At1g09820-like n=1 Tax=Beta vulgaris subsp. vulgaris TaxID=3555 RepID=UPI0009011DDF|nr:pentatricopeptide repeat-containing protein At1g09820-like [Beta vulgaris subsp. vulgaris]